MTALGSVFEHAGTAITAVPDLACADDWPSVQVRGSLFIDNGFDIFNGNKHTDPCGEAVDATGSTALKISFHTHFCAAFLYTDEPEPIPQPELDETYVAWDVEGVFPDGKCPKALVVAGGIIKWSDIGV